MFAHAFKSSGTLLSAAFEADARDVKSIRILSNPADLTLLSYMPRFDFVTSLFVCCSNLVLVVNLYSAQTVS